MPHDPFLHTRDLFLFNFFHEVFFFFISCYLKTLFNNVLINLQGLEDEGFVQEMKDSVAQLRDASNALSMKALTAIDEKLTATD